MNAGIGSLLSCCIGALVAAPVYGGGNTVTVNAVGPECARPGETVVIDFMISAEDPGFFLRGYMATPPCALAPQEGATGTVDGPLIALDETRSDWAACGGPCNCVCASFPMLDFGNCPDADPPRVGWSNIFTEDTPAVGVGPAYLAHVEYTVSGDATGSFDFEFVDPETPAGGTGCVLRDENTAPVFGDWIGTTIVIVDDCAEPQQPTCDDIRTLQAVCDPPGNPGRVVGSVRFNSNAHDGKTVTIIIDGVPLTRVINNDRARATVAGAPGSVHTVAFADPDCCLQRRVFFTVTCHVR